MPTEGEEIKRAASKPSKPQHGELMEAEVLATYLGQRRGTLVLYRDRITVPNGFTEERFELVRVAQGVRWQRTR